jgi:exosome complex component RRP42
MELSNITKKRIVEYLSEGKRFDARKLLEYRQISIEMNISKNADGSARVRMGNTEVVAGVKLDVGTPFTDSQDAGVLVVTTELSPLASEKFELGPPGIESIELARLVDRGIRESGFIDFKKLCIKEGEKVWSIFLDIYPMNDDGNLIDASCMAAVAALCNTRMPKYDEEKEKVKFGEWTNKKLPLTDKLPLTMTFHKISKSIILDPITEEEEASEARLTVEMSLKDKEPVINALQKGNAKELSKEEVFDILEKAEKEWHKLYPLILEKIEAEKKKHEK